MNAENQVLVIDAGNTSIKVGLFYEGELIKVCRFSLDDLGALSNWIEDHRVTKSVLSSVLSAADTRRILSLTPDTFSVDSSTRLPIKLNYKSKNTLGIDRICNAVYMGINCESTYGVSVDIGTCIKFDMVQKQNGYLGGSIAPGIALRYKSLNDYTGNLPLLSNKSNTNLVGNDTKSSIQSGVINGIHCEIEHMMEHYTEQYSDLTFFVTGGDASFFDIHSKNDIFADENLTLKGLFEIYKYNA